MEYWTDMIPTLIVDEVFPNMCLMFGECYSSEEPKCSNLATMQTSVPVGHPHISDASSLGPKCRGHGVPNTYQIGLLDV
jgi:hypothetical protein